MNAGEGQPRSLVPTALVWAFLVLLVVPFDPFWVDFEQVRRGLLLLLAGAVLLLRPALPAIRGEAFVWALLLGLVGCGGIAWLGEVWFAEATAPATFQPLDALYRVAHWGALLVVLRLGAQSGQATALPFVNLLALTAGFGLLQRLGLGEIAGYGVEREPVSVFGNLNVASEWTAIAAMVVTVLLPEISGRRARPFALVALGLASAYLVVNQSRSGLIALPIGLLLLAVMQRKSRDAWLPALLAALAGAALGLACAVAVTRPEPVDLRATRAELKRATSTLEVRLEIARSTTKLWAESPIFGRGPAQFAVHYPRVRTQKEIELSSHGRQFATEARTAHDDWLELLVDGGLVALALFAAMLFGLQREQRDRTRLLPLFVLLLLMLVRSPLWNAPAVVAALFLVPLPAAPAKPRWPRARVPLALLGGALLVALGVPQLMGNHHAARWQQDIRNSADPSLERLHAAHGWMPHEPRWLSLLAQEQLTARDYPAARLAAGAAVALRPFDPQAYALLAEVLVNAGVFEFARPLVQHALKLDPANPELRTWSSWLATEQGRHDDAITAVAEDPHAQLRPRLARHFFELARFLAKRGDGRGEARMLLEHHVQGAIDSLDDTSPGGMTSAHEHAKEAGTAAGVAERRGDARPHVRMALLLLDTNRDLVRQLGDRAAKMPPLTGWQRAQFGDRLARLDGLENWAAWLARR